MNPIIGIYAIENTVTEQRYIGSSVDVNRRGLAHLSALRRGRHENQYLQAAWNKYGEESFLIGVVEECDPTDDLLAIEMEYVALQGHYNIAREIGRPPSRKGQHNSSEHRERCRQANLGKVRGPRSEETKAKLRAANIGQKRHPSVGVRVSAALTGRTLSAEHRAAISRGNTGKTLSAETRAKLSAARRRRCTS